MEFKRILVTGGCGFIGSNFIRYMLSNHKDLEIVNLDKLTYAGRRENLQDVEERFKDRYSFLQGDICDEKIVREAIANCDAVINFAAESHVDRAILGAKEFVRTNVEGTLTLLDAAKIERERGRKIRFLQIGTDEVYGSIANGSAKEDWPLKPRNPYSATKAAADLLALSYFNTHNLDVVITRSSNNFGPYQFPEKVIPLFITNLIDNKKVPLYGTGKNVREWLYVIDNCRAIDLALHKGNSGEIYNIGSSFELTNLELTKKILAEFNYGEEMIKFVKDRPGHDLRYSLNSEKIRGLGWKPNYNFDQALKETVEWYKQNEWWWRPLKDKAVGGERR